MENQQEFSMNEQNSQFSSVLSLDPNDLEKKSETYENKINELMTEVAALRKKLDE